MSIMKTSTTANSCSPVRPAEAAPNRDTTSRADRKGALASTDKPVGRGTSLHHSDRLARPAFDTASPESPEDLSLVRDALEGVSELVHRAVHRLDALCWDLPPEASEAAQAHHHLERAARRLGYAIEGIDDALAFTDPNKEHRIP
jgi:hypothetical protein